jgi:hypothetical protein
MVNGEGSIRALPKGKASVGKSPTLKSKSETLKKKRKEEKKMTYYVRYWMDDEETAVTVEELATTAEEARRARRYLALEEITATEMHFTIYELED